MMFATIIEIEEDGITIDSGIAYRFPPSYFPENIQLNDIVFLNERVCMFALLKEYEMKLEKKKND